MKIIFAISVCVALAGCDSPKSNGHVTSGESPGESAKLMYWQLQQPHAADDGAPRYRRLTITIPAHTEGGVSYEDQTRTILIAE